MKLKFASIITALTFSAPSMANSSLKGKVKIDGSSTVYPITEAVAETFQEVYPRVRVTIGVSGTGGGFKKFIADEIDINDASRRIKDKEVEKASARGLTYSELPVAYDGISVVINKKNTWAKEITMAELKKIWEPNSKVTKWSDVNPAWPNKEIKLYGPGADSGTFDYFTKKVNGKSRASRADYTASEDDNVIVNGVSGDVYSMGYFGYAYFHENRSKLNAVALKKKTNYIPPTMNSIADSSYPLARPIFIYVSHKAAKRPAVAAFVEFYMQNADKLSKEVGYIPMSKKDYAKRLNTFKKAVSSKG
jgi:phosphate transport system substrate-binding protein